MFELRIKVDIKILRCQEIKTLFNPRVQRYEFKSEPFKILYTQFAKQSNSELRSIKLSVMRHNVGSRLPLEPHPPKYGKSVLWPRVC